MGIEIDRKRVPLMNGSTRSDPCIWFSGFSSQGDGACFEGRYGYTKGAAQAVRQHAPIDTELHQIADELRAIQRRHFYRLTAHVKHHGHYYHEHCTDIDVCNNVTGDETDAATAGVIKTLFHDFMRWIYKQLEAEHDYLLSDEAVDESIVCNEYEFTEEGKLA